MPRTIEKVLCSEVNAVKKQGILFLWLIPLLWWPFSQQAILEADATAEIWEPRYLALTFDDGPKEGTTDLLLDGLKERGAAATFFLLGDQAVLYPELVRRMQEEGHQVGNHTWSHKRLDGDVKAAVSEVERMEGLLREILGEGEHWLRPPYGVITEEAAAKITVPIIKWSVDPRDWESRNADVVTQRILDAVRPNSIILLHDIYPTSVEAALRVVDILQEEGYWFVTVEELLRINRAAVHPGAVYRSGK